MFPAFLVDNRGERSVASHLRRKRFRLLRAMIETAARESGTGAVTILDVGGLERFWKLVLRDLPGNVRLSVTLLNLERQPVTLPNLTSVAGDGRDMPQFRDRQFDIVFSNSTIEHVGDLDDQRRFASEVRRVGRRYWVQTPNRNFPVEPHFVFPFFQFLPLEWRTWLVQHFQLGWYPRASSRAEALDWVTEIRLLDRRELLELFPDAHLHEERVLGLVKSFVAYRP